MSIHLPHLGLRLPHSDSGVLRREVTQLRGQLADKDQQIRQLAVALDDALDREQLHSLSAPHERLTPAAVIDRYGQPRAHHDRTGVTGSGEPTQAGQAPAHRPAMAGQACPPSQQWEFER
ncbi:hypothetical protein [Nocardia sp. CS682]|uniref:hypothetical protein n=1 Tax=Nocardia sp. CS682 TaxID=1047172 RepID=UPI001074B091|nr:hypothetical protein [Nocardia sp. CS682]QBS43567.1 hypothetical protein DMB37_29150 [Nocardia sp. CS682]